MSGEPDDIDRTEDEGQERKEFERLAEREHEKNARVARIAGGMVAGRKSDDPVLCPGCGREANETFRVELKGNDGTIRKAQVVCDNCFEGWAADGYRRPIG